MLQLINLFKEQAYEIVFASSAEKSDYSFPLEDIGVEEKSIKLNDSSFDEWIKTENPAIVLFDRFVIEEQYGWRVSEQCPDTIKILDTEDLHCLRKERERAFTNRDDFTINSLLTSDVAKREIASIYRCDLSLMISSYEVKLLKEVFKVPTELLFQIPFLHDLVAVKIENELSFNERTDFITIGNFLHKPNYDSVLYLKKEIWPLIRKQLPKATMKVFGAYASQKVNQLHNVKEGFLVKGRANDALEEFGKARICLAPIRYGAGLKTKLVESMLSGVPNVTTSIGAEGFEYEEWSGFIEDTPEEFAVKAIQLYTDEKLWDKKKEVGKDLLSQFDINKYKESFINKITHLSINLQEHRESNFIGSMLNHHTVKSTKYLSKWIEEKNKKA